MSKTNQSPRELGKRKAAPVEKQVKAKTKRQLPLVSIAMFISAIIGTALFCLAAYLVYSSYILDNEKQRLDVLSKQQAEKSAANIADFFDTLRTDLNAFAAQPAVVKAIQNNQHEILEAQQRTIVSQMEGAVAARFFVRGRAKLKLDAYPPVRFSELEMINQIERGEHIFPEALSIEGNWLFNHVVPVKDDSGVIGTLLVTLDSAVLTPPLIDENEALGKASLLQFFSQENGKTVTFAGEGNAGAMSEYTIDSSHWRVQFQPSQKLRERARLDATIVYILMALGAIGLIAAALFAGHKIGRSIEQKQLFKSDANRPGQDGASKAHYSEDILDIEISDEDKDLLGLEDVSNEFLTSSAPTLKIEELDVAAVPDNIIPEIIFRAYDIRGIVDVEITPETAEHIGQALGSEVVDHGETTIIVARDGRTHSTMLTEALVKGILSTGCHVLDIGVVPTPLLYFATETLDVSRSGVMVTASHNPAEYNGFKVVIKGKCRAEDDIKAIRSRILQRNIRQGNGKQSEHDIVPEYINTIFSDVALAGDISIVIDAGNGVTGLIAPRLFEELGCDVTPLHCELDGTFPNHTPDPSVEENLSELIAKVKSTGADLGVAFDGDGDRLVVITPKGEIIWPDRLLMLYAKDIVSRNPGTDVVFDVKSTRHLNSCITSYGGRPIVWKTGHSPMKNKMVETGALIGGEYSGHIFIKDRWFGFDDGLYAAARLIEIVSLQGEDIDQIFSEFPKTISTPEIRVKISEKEKFALIDKLKEEGDFSDAKLHYLDGIRADFAHGWGLVRASNTSANLTLRFEADDEQSMAKIKDLFATELRKVDSTIDTTWNKS